MFSPLPSYILGTACIIRSLMATFSPRAEYGHVGLPLEGSDDQERKKRLGGGSVSPLMYFKAIREFSYGATLVLLEYEGLERAVTTFAAVLAVVRLVDGWIVWEFGEEEKKRAWGHWITGLGFVGWVGWRWTRA